MRRIAVVAPGWIGSSELDSVLVRPGEYLQLWGSAASVGVTRVSSDQPSASPDAAWLGLNPERYSVQPGPLAAACFGASPPWGSTCFHVSLLGTDGESVWTPTALQDAEAAELIHAARALDTSDSYLIQGEGSDHALATRKPEPECMLAWPKRLLEAGYREATRDLELRLRRWIEDSVNLLQDHDVNRKRMDQGLPPANLLWPWGAGRVRSYEPWSPSPQKAPWVASGSIRVNGLAQLARMPRKPRSWFRGRSEAPLELLADDAFQTTSLLVHLADFHRARAAEDWDRLAWLQQRFENCFLRAILEQARKVPTRLLLAAIGNSSALVGVADSEQPRSNEVPFDERALASSPNPSTLLHEEVARFFREDELDFGGR